MGLTVAFKHVCLAALLFHGVWVIDCVLKHLIGNAELSRLISRYFAAVIGLRRGRLLLEWSLLYTLGMHSKYTV